MRTDTHTAPDPPTHTQALLAFSLPPAAAAAHVAALHRLTSASTQDDGDAPAAGVFVCMHVSYYVCSAPPDLCYLPRW